MSLSHGGMEHGTMFHDPPTCPHQPAAVTLGKWHARFSAAQVSVDCPSACHVRRAAAVTAAACHIAKRTHGVNTALNLKPSILSMLYLIWCDFCMSCCQQAATSSSTPMTPPLPAPAVSYTCDQKVRHHTSYFIAHKRQHGLLKASSSLRMIGSVFAGDACWT